ncbi:hypothetical protein LIER_14966 [Lithospermum erythrorhizon]|uniref:Uncharacterized protein n=1 Tax=Lithospermum erythrorhizon TaxID=34254 RepID=A0AAV3Q557_LITER
MVTNNVIDTGGLFLSILLMVDPKENSVAVAVFTVALAIDVHCSYVHCCSSTVSFVLLRLVLFVICAGGVYSG